MTDNAFFHNRCVLDSAQLGRLSAMRITVVGAGGLGGFVINGLARLGARQVTVVDGDRFEKSNLNRQLFARLGNIGELKAEASAAAVREAVGAEYRALPVWLEVSNIDTIFSGCELAFDCVDSFETKLLIEDWCVEHAVPYIHGGVSGDYGQAAFVSGTRLLGGMTPAVRESENAVVLPQLVAALQLQLLVGYLAGRCEANRLYAVDMRRLEIEKI